MLTLVSNQRHLQVVKRTGMNQHFTIHISKCSDAADKDINPKIQNSHS